MIRRYAVKLLVLASIAFFGSSSYSEESLELAPKTGRGFVFRISKSGRNGILVGSIHGGFSEADRIDVELLNQVRSIRALFVEADISRKDAMQSAFQQYAVAKDGVKLSERVGQRAYAVARLLTARHGMSEDALEQLRPWAVTMLLPVADYRRRRLPSPELGTDVQLMDVAKSRGIDIAELEGPHLQMAAFAALRADEEEKYLRSYEELIESGYMNDYFIRIVHAWEESDFAALDSVVSNFRHGGSDYAQIYFQRILDSRNSSLASVITENLMKTAVADVSMFVVGAEHLVGPSGVIASMRRSGVAVTPALR